MGKDFSDILNGSELQQMRESVAPPPPLTLPQGHRTMPVVDLGEVQEQAQSVGPKGRVR